MPGYGVAKTPPHFWPPKRPLWGRLPLRADRPATTTSNTKWSDSTPSTSFQVLRYICIYICIYMHMYICTYTHLELALYLPTLACHWANRRSVFIGFCFMHHPGPQFSQQFAAFDLTVVTSFELTMVLPQATKCSIKCEI